MGLGYTLAYRFKITPWVKAGRVFGNQIETLIDPFDAPPGEVLDIYPYRGSRRLRRGPHDPDAASATLPSS